MNTTAQFASAWSAAEADSDNVAATNAANILIADEANKMQRELFYSGQQFNQQENALNRFLQMDLQDSAQRYNSIQEQVKRAIAAGVNPASILGSGSTPVSAVSGGSGLGSPSVPAAHAPMTMPSRFGSQFLQNLAALTGIKNVEAQTEKTNKESQRLMTENRYVDMLMKANIGLTEAQAVESYARADSLDKQLEQIHQNIIESKARVGVLTEEQYKKAFENAIAAPFAKANLDLLTKELDIKEAQAKYWLEGVGMMLYGLDLSNRKTLTEIGVNEKTAAYLNNLGRLIGSEADQAGLRYSLDQVYMPAERGARFLSSLEDLDNKEWRNGNTVRFVSLFGETMQGVSNAADAYSKARHPRAGYHRQQSQGFIPGTYPYD